MKLEEAKKLQNVSKSNLNENQEVGINQKSKNVLWKILNCFTNHEKLSSKCLMIILKLYLRLNTNQFIEKGSKY